MREGSTRRWKRPPCSKCGGRFRDHRQGGDHAYEYRPPGEIEIDPRQQAFAFAEKAKTAKRLRKRPSEV